MRFLSINLISKTRYVGDARIRVIIGCRASSNLQFELLPWCSLGKNVFISIPLVILQGSPLRLPQARSTDQVRCWVRGQGVCFWVTHFTVVCLVAWPLNQGEDGVDSVFLMLMMPFSMLENNLLCGFEFSGEKF